MRRIERIAVRIVVTFAAAASTALGCGPSSSAPQEAPGQAMGGSTAQAGVCPDTLEATAGAPCDTEGLMCGPQYACEGLVAAARCTCAGGTFSCLDVKGQPIAGTDGGPVAPSCPARRDAEACPSSVAQATLAPCTEPYLVCTYPTDCDATPAFRQCTCALGPLPSGATGFAFRCPNDCPYVGPPIEPIVVDAAAD